MPLDHWFRNELRPAFEEQVLGDSAGDLNWVDRRYVRGLWEAHQSGAYQYGATLWTLWAFKLWLRSLRRSPEADEVTEELVLVG